MKHKFNLQSSLIKFIILIFIDQYTNIIKQKQYILLLSRLKCKKNIRTKTNRGKTFINIWITKVILFCGKSGRPLFWHYNVIRIWAISGPFSRFLVIFYPLSPHTPFLKMFFSTLSFLWTTRVGPLQNI